MVRTKVVAHLGLYDEFIKEHAPDLLRKLEKILGLGEDRSKYEDGRDLGEVLACLSYSQKLGLGHILNRRLNGSRHEFNVVRYIQVLIVNPLCNPQIKLAIGEWLKGVYFPGMSEIDFVYHHALQAMDWLIANKEKIELDIRHRFLNMFDTTVKLVFYDVTSSYFTSDRSIDEADEEEIWRKGYSRDHISDKKQITIGLVMTQDGFPLCHYVFPGNTKDKVTVQGVINDVKGRFGLIEHVFIVGDRGMLSGKNLERITEQELGFIISHPLRGNSVLCQVIEKTLGPLKRMSEHF